MLYEYILLHPNTALSAWLIGKCLAFVLLHLALVITKIISYKETN